MKNLINKVHCFAFLKIYFLHILLMWKVQVFYKNMLIHNRLLIGTFNKIDSFYPFWNK